MQDILAELVYATVYEHEHVAPPSQLVYTCVPCVFAKLALKET